MIEAWSSDLTVILVVISYEITLNVEYVYFIAGIQSWRDQYGGGLFENAVQEGFKFKKVLIEPDFEDVPGSGF